LGIPTDSVTWENALANPALAELKTADEAAHAGIRQMMRDVERRDYGAATQAYMQAEGAIDKTIAAAQTLYKALGSS
jgi:hypothetical protein